ncbi:hypothetical protein PLIIFM63780_007493 [Purpureocillium lilacinum]|nr:hypothetical protein PLIIFM63780_007493 [Purpureocillium lilacinum]
MDPRQHQHQQHQHPSQHQQHHHHQRQPVLGPAHHQQQQQQQHTAPAPHPRAPALRPEPTPDYHSHSNSHFAVAAPPATSSSSSPSPSLYPPRAPATRSPAASNSPFSARAAGPYATADHRRTSDTPYYPPAARSSLPDLGHSRAQSASSLPSARELNRTMPPPTSPPQPGAPPPPSHHQQHQGGMGFGPPPPRPPPVAVGPPTSFPSGRELPALSSLTRSGSGGSSMSISSMLGGPPPASRDSQPPPQHYPPHTSAPPPGSGPGYAPPVHASPRMHSASSDYPPFRRPQTPDHQRPYDPRGGTAPSPRGGHYSTPEVQRYGTPGAGYHARHPSAPADTSREPGRMSTGPAPTPNAPPKPYGSMPPHMGRPEDPYARREEPGRPGPGMDYPERSGLRPYPYDDRYRAERERQTQPERDREGRERAYSGGDAHRHMMSPHEMGHREPPQPQGPYGRPPDARDQRDPRDSQWGRHSAESSYRAPMDHPRQEYPPSTTYPPHHAAYQTAPPERYPPASHPPQHPPPHANAPPQPYDSPDRARMDHLHQQQQQQQQPQPHHPLHRPRPGEEAPPPPPSIAYNGAGHMPPGYDASRNRSSEEAPGPNSHQRNLLAVQDMNRKGRLSPLPQAVQGAQPQQPGPAAEPGIKSEFGRMFSGIGSGVGAIGASSPMTSGAVAAHGSQANVSVPPKREDAEAAAPDSGPEGTKPAKGRRRKLKDEDNKDDDSSGRVTPGGRANKRTKGHQHHHHQYALHPFPQELSGLSNQGPSHHHHHHHHGPEGTASPTGGAAPLKNLKGGPAVASPTDKSVPHHHHHHHHGPKAAQTPAAQAKQPAPAPAPVIPPKPKTIISNKAVLDAVADRPRHHLGDFIYEPGLKPGRLLPDTPSHRGFSSNPTPLPWETIKGKENCILTVKVPRVHLVPLAREEITSRAYLWGTDVYTDDSDVVAACIHSGWIKGEWVEDVDASMLDLEDVGRRKPKNQPTETMPPGSEGLITAPPTSGPLSVPADRDLHVNVLILPRLVKYAATTRHGITSREFGGQFGTRHAVHDGISYMVKSIRWVENGGQPQARLRGKARRERMRKVMKEVTASFGNMNSLEQHPAQEQQPDKDQSGVLRSEIAANWHRKEAEHAPTETAENGGEKARDPSEGDKENWLSQDKTAADPAPEAAPAPATGRDVEMAEAEAPQKTATEEEK